ncbi:MAG: hypothetical protein ABI761_07235 [Saprospiraceae bacterium]
MKKLLLCFIILGCVSSRSHSQTNGVKLEETPVVSKLSDYFVQYNLRKSEWPGWRIQVFVSADRREMESTLSSFRNRFPQYYAKWSLNDPYYQIRAGIFIDYGEAMKNLQEIRKSFRSATLVADHIRREEVLSL